MANVIKLEAVKNAEDVGVKAVNISKLINNGAPVPSGFVITTNAFKRFLAAGRLEKRISELLGKQENNIYDVYREIEKLISDAELPDALHMEIKDAYDELSIGREVKELGGMALDLVKAGRGQSFVTVRSSPTSEELEMDIVLNAHGMSQLIRAIKKCWTALFSPKIILENRKTGYRNFPLIAVIVQKMVNAEKSGIIYTSNPDNGNADEMLIEAAWGNGTVYEDFIIPDTYILNKSNGEIVRKRIKRKPWSIETDESTGNLTKRRVSDEKACAQVLSEYELKKIFDVISSIGMEGTQEIEWCIERNKVYIIQSERGKTLEQTHKQEPMEKSILDGIHVSNGNASGTARIVLSPDDFDKVEDGDIIIVGSVSAGMSRILNKVTGIVTNFGGRRCRTSRLANKKNIPCIVGTENATNVLEDGQEIVLMNGKVYKKATVEHEMHTREEIGNLKNIPYGVIATNVKLSLAFPELNKDIVNKCDGIGVLKPENLLTNNGKHPLHFARENSEEAVERIVSEVGRIAKMFYPKIVWYRFLDMKTNELKDLETGNEEEIDEDNPLVGWHGLRRALDQQDLLRCEMEAIEKLNSQGITNIGVLVPFVSTIEEFKMLKEMYPSIGRLKTGIVVATPSSGLDIESFCKEGISYVLIDIDVLAQLVLGVDRNNNRIVKLYSEANPAVLNLIRQVVQKCKQYNIEVCIAGDSCSDPQTVEKFVETGVNSISTDPESIEMVKDAIARAEKRLLLDRAREKSEEPMIKPLDNMNYSSNSISSV